MGEEREGGWGEGRERWMGAEGNFSDLEEIWVGGGKGGG